MVGPKSIQTRVVGIITDEIHPYTIFIETLLLENTMQGMHFIYYPYYSYLYTFWSYHPYFFNLFSCFLYLCNNSTTNLVPTLPVFFNIGKVWIKAINYMS